MENTLAASLAFTRALIPLFGKPQAEHLDLGRTHDVCEIGWDRIEVDPDGRTLIVHHFDGIPECNGMDNVAVSPGERGLEVRVLVELLDDQGRAR